MLSGPGTDAVDMAWLGWSAMLGHVCPVEERWAPASIRSTTPQSPVLVVELVDHAGRAGMSSPSVAASPLRAVFWRWCERNELVTKARTLICCNIAGGDFFVNAHVFDVFIPTC